MRLPRAMGVATFATLFAGRQPNRARSLLGAARAAAQAGDRAGAAATYAKLVEQWNQADPELPELREAREFVKSQPQITSKN